MSLSPSHSTPLAYRTFVIDREGDPQGRSLPGDIRPAWQALSEVLRDEPELLNTDMVALESRIEDTVMEARCNGVLSWNGRTLRITFKDREVLDHDLYEKVVKGLVDVRPGMVRVGEREYEVEGYALDALTLAEVFVQLFSLDQAEALLKVSREAAETGMEKEAKAIRVGVLLWVGAEDCYAKSGQTDRAKQMVAKLIEEGK